MKRFIAVFMLASFVLVNTACTGGSGSESYVYYFAADVGVDGNGTVLHTIMKKNEKKNNGDSKPYSESFDGRDIEEAFLHFFEKYADAYTGTVKEYAVTEALGERGYESFKLYLANSPGLPVKKTTEKVKDATAYIEEKLAEESN